MLSKVGEKTFENVINPDNDDNDDKLFLRNE